MLPRRRRLSREHFTSLLKQRGIRTAYNAVGTLKYLPEKGGFAVVTSSRYEKRATVRNRIRRQVYRFLQTNQFPLTGILYISKQAYLFDREKVTELLYALLKKTTDTTR